jgi:hypothetical protein
MNSEVVSVKKCVLSENIMLKKPYGKKEAENHKNSFQSTASSCEEICESFVDKTESFDDIKFNNLIPIPNTVSLQLVTVKDCETKNECFKNNKNVTFQEVQFPWGSHSNNELDSKIPSSMALKPNNTNYWKSNFIDKNLSHNTHHIVNFLFETAQEKEAENVIGIYHAFPCFICVISGVACLSFSVWMLWNASFLLFRNTVTHSFSTQTYSLYAWGFSLSILAFLFLWNSRKYCYSYYHHYTQTIMKRFIACFDLFLKQVSWIPKSRFSSLFCLRKKKFLPPPIQLYTPPVTVTV